LVGSLDPAAFAHLGDNRGARLPHYAVLEQLAGPDGLLAKALAVFVGTDSG
jgi:hypothetical protein